MIYVSLCHFKKKKYIYICVDWWDFKSMCSWIARGSWSASVHRCMKQTIDVNSSLIVSPNVHSPAQLNTMGLESFGSYLIKWSTIQVIKRLAVCTLLEKLGIKLNLLSTQSACVHLCPNSHYSIWQKKCLHC